MAVGGQLHTLAAVFQDKEPSHPFIFFRFYFFINVYMVLFLFNNVIYVFLLL